MALTAAPDQIAFLAFPGINHLVLAMIAIRASHLLGLMYLIVPANSCLHSGLLIHPESAAAGAGISLIRKRISLLSEETSPDKVFFWPENPGWIAGFRKGMF